MDFEHTLLLLLFILPLAYKIAFWKKIFSANVTVVQKLQLGYTHFFSYIELPLFFLSLVVYYNPDLEVFFFNFFLYFFALLHIFIFGKMFRRQHPFGPESLLNLTLSLCVCILFFLLADSSSQRSLYALMSGVYMGLPYFYLCFSLGSLWKK